MSKYISWDDPSLSENEKIIIQLLEWLGRANTTANMLNGAFIGYAASRGDRMKDILLHYADEIREYFVDVNNSELLEKLDKKYGINHE